LVKLFLNFGLHTKASTFAIRTNPPHGPKIAKELAFRQPKKNLKTKNPMLQKNRTSHTNNP